MSENPDAIRADIEETRRRLGSNVDAVADKVTPSHIVQRQTDKVRDAVFGVKDKVMGAADQMTDKVQSGTGTAADGMGRAGSAAGDAPHKLAGKAQGNPMAAGLIAFGAGLLAASLIPASEKERVAADNLKTAAEPLTNQVADVAQGLREPAREAMENVKTTAAEAAQNVQQESQSAAGDVKDKAADAKDNVRGA